MWSRPSALAMLRAELGAAGIASEAPALPFHDIPRASPPPAGLAAIRIEDYAAAIAAHMRGMAAPPVLLGHSMGGLVAQLAAQAVRPAGLVLLSTAPSAAAQAQALGPYRTLGRIALRWGWWRRPTLIDAASARWGIFNGVPATEAEEAIAELTWDSGRVLAQIAFPGLDPARATAVAYGRLSGVPCLLVCGRADRITPHRVTERTARALAAAGARVETMLLPETGHWLFHDAVRPRVAGRIARFLAAL